MGSLSGTAVRYHRKIIRICAEDSPNVQFALNQIARGEVPTNEILVPGLLTYEEYVHRRKTWDKRRQTVGLDAQFYKGAEVLLYPPVWLSRAKQLAQLLRGHKRKAVALGIDPGEGAANSSFCVVDRLGVLDLRSIKTPDTSDVQTQAIQIGREWAVPPEMWFFDRGGGGRQHADYLRTKGYHCNTVAFGERVVPPPTPSIILDQETRTDDAEKRYAYKNRRAEMYGLARNLLDPIDEDSPVLVGCKGFAIPDWNDALAELHRQLALFPLLYDGNGVMYLPSKARKDKNSTEITLTEILGASPDEADAFVLAVWGMLRSDRRPTVGVW